MLNHERGEADQAHRGTPCQGDFVGELVRQVLRGVFRTHLVLNNTARATREAKQPQSRRTVNAVDWICLHRDASCLARGCLHEGHVGRCRVGLPVAAAAADAADSNSSREAAVCVTASLSLRSCSAVLTPTPGVDAAAARRKAASCVLQRPGINQFSRRAKAISVGVSPWRPRQRRAWPGSSCRFCRPVYTSQ